MWSIWIVRVVFEWLVMISRVTILVIYVVLGHLYTVIHCPDLPTLAPSTLLRSYDHACIVDSVYGRSGESGLSGCLVEISSGTILVIYVQTSP